MKRRRSNNNKSNSSWIVEFKLRWIFSFSISCCIIVVQNNTSKTSNSNKSQNPHGENESTANQQLIVSCVYKVLSSVSVCGEWESKSGRTYVATELSTQRFEFNFQWPVHVRCTCAPLISVCLFVLVYFSASLAQPKQSQCTHAERKHAELLFMFTNTTKKLDRKQSSMKIIKGATLWAHRAFW